MKLAHQRIADLRRLSGAFWRDERGQSTTEYILILSVVVMIAMKFKTVFSQKLIGTVNKLGDDIDQVVNSSAEGN